MVGFVLAQLLDRRTRSRSLDDESRLDARCRGNRKNPRFACEVGEEAISRAFQPRLGVSLKDDLKTTVDGKTAGAFYYMRRQRHDGQL